MESHLTVFGQEGVALSGGRSDSRCMSIFIWPMHASHCLLWELPQQIACC